jgi:hypothetical protein
MIISVPCKVKEIFEQGREYEWSRPERCPGCRASPVWGHGFVTAYFDGVSGFVYLRRWRCPSCRCVIRVRPCGYFRRFQASVAEVRSRLSFRLREGRWPSGMSAPRQGHWLRALTRRARAYLDNTWQGSLLDAFDYFMGVGRIPVSRSL